MNYNFKSTWTETKHARKPEAKARCNNENTFIFRIGRNMFHQFRLSKLCIDTINHDDCNGSNRWCNTIPLWCVSFGVPALQRTNKHVRAHSTKYLLNESESSVLCCVGCSAVIYDMSRTCLISFSSYLFIFSIARKSIFTVFRLM